VKRKSMDTVAAIVVAGPVPATGQTAAEPRAVGQKNRLLGDTQ